MINLIGFFVNSDDENRLIFYKRIEKHAQRMYNRNKGKMKHENGAKK